jgi:hypothetical protein
MAVSLSALHASHHFIPQKHYFSASGAHFCWQLSKPQGPVWSEELGKSIKSFTSSDLSSFTQNLMQTCCSILASITRKTTREVEKAVM